MMSNNGANGWFSRRGSANDLWLREEFDDIIGGPENAKDMGAAKANEDDWVVRLHTWAEDGDYDEPTSATGCWERTSPFPDLQTIRGRSRED
ncbi:MAG: hypothetical protein ACRDIE_04360 [Chloroflexota bacterium]